MEKEALEQLEKKISELSVEESRERDIYLRDLAIGTIQGPKVGYPHIDKPWLQHYDESKIHFDLPNQTVYEFALAANKDNMEGIALEYFGTKITYREFFEKIEAATKAFLKLGIKKGDIVSFCAPSLPETFYMFYALNRIGAIANMIDPRTNVSSIKKFIDDADSKMIVYIDIAYPKLKDIIEQSEIKNIVSLSVTNSLPSIKKVLFKVKSFLESLKRKKLSPSNKIMSYSSFINYGNDYNFQEIELGDKINLPSGVVYTSGTTGVPKGSLMKNKNFLSMVYQNHSVKMGWDKNDIILGIMPPFIAYGLVCGFVLPICNGMQIDIIPKFQKEKFPNYIKKHRPNHIMGVPDYVDGLTTSKKLARQNLSYLKTVIVGGNRMVISSEKKVNEFLASHGSKARVSKGYGMTEMSSNAVYTINEDCNELGSIGVPLVENNFKIMDEFGNPIGYNEVGEVALTGPTLIEGYLNNPEENAKTFKTHAGTRWVHTGDTAYMREDGLVFFEDRLKRIIIRSDGHNVWPSKIEQIIEKNPYVKQCCVVGLKDPNSQNGEIPTAFIVLNEGGLEICDQIIKEVHDASLLNLPERDVALEYIVQDTLPTTLVGKVDYMKLSETDLADPKIKRIGVKK